MPKLKRNSGAAKRFKVNKSGRVKFKRCNKRHILTKKSQKRKRTLRAKQFLKDCDAKLVKRMVCEEGK